MGDRPGIVGADRLCNVGQVIVQLVITPGQQVHPRLRDHLGIQVGMRRWHRSSSPEGREHVNPHAVRKLGKGPSAARELILRWPPSPTGLNHDQHSRLKATHSWRLLGERGDEDCLPADGQRDRAVVQVRHLRWIAGLHLAMVVASSGRGYRTLNFPNPPGALCRLTNGIITVVRLRAAALDEQDLASPCHGVLHRRPRSHLSHHRWRCPAAGGLVEGCDGFAANTLNWPHTARCVAVADRPADRLRSHR